MSMANLPEVWLRGPVDGYSPIMMPAAEHSTRHMGQAITTALILKT